MNKDLKKFNFTLTDSTAWYGQDTVDFYSSALLGFNTSKYLTLVPNVKSKIKLASYNAGSIVQAENTTWNPTGEGVLAQKTFSVCPFKVNEEYFKSTFEQDYLSEYMKSGSNTDEVTAPAFQSYIINQLMKKVSNDLEVMSWGAAAPSANLCDGLITKFSADSNTIKVTSSAVTSTNVLAILTAVYNRIPTALLPDKENVKFYVSADVMRAYSLFQASTGAGQGFNFAGEQKMNFLGYEVVEASGMLPNTIVAASQKNLILLTDLMGDIEDESNIVIIPQLHVSGVPSLRIRLGFKFAVDYKVSTEIVWLTASV